MSYLLAASLILVVFGWLKVSTIDNQIPMVFAVLWLAFGVLLMAVHA